MNLFPDLNVGCINFRNEKMRRDIIVKTTDLHVHICRFDAYEHYAGGFVVFSGDSHAIESEVPIFEHVIFQ